VSDRLNEVAPESALFDRVVAILEQARSNVVRAVNSNMIMAYWLIGREIVQALQSGEERAEYCKQVLQQLSHSLTKRYGNGLSEATLHYFRAFHLAYSERDQEIPRPMGAESGNPFHPQLSWLLYRVLMKLKPRWRSVSGKKMNSKEENWACVPGNLVLELRGMRE
jgi:DUF1016 N-terminal domain